MITVPGNTPSKKTSQRRIWSRNRPFIIPSKLHENWYKQARLTLEGYYSDVVIDKRVYVRMKFFRKTKRKFDYTNAAESIMDLLVDCRMLKDDSTEYAIPVFDPIVEYDKDNPRCEIEIEEVE